MIGNMLRERESQYIATRDEGTQTWRILDTWHDVLRDMNPEDEVEGILQNASSSFMPIDTREPEDYSNEVQEKEEELAEMRKKIVKYEEEISTLRISASKSEGTLLKELAMETLLKLTLSSDIEKLTTRKD